MSASSIKAPSREQGEHAAVFPRCKSSEIQMSHSRILLLLAICACHHEKKPVMVPAPAPTATATQQAAPPKQETQAVSPNLAAGDDLVKQCSLVTVKQETPRFDFDNSELT